MITWQPIGNQGPGGGPCFQGFGYALGTVIACQYAADNGYEVGIYYNGAGDVIGWQYL